MKKNYVSLLLTGMVFFSTKIAYSQNSSLREIEPPTNHYGSLAKYNLAPNPERAWMDTIYFPWNEYGKSALSYSIYRPVYLTQDDERKISLLAKSKLPANSSDQTKAEMDYLLNLQNNRTEKDIEKSEAIAYIGSWIILNPSDQYNQKNQNNLFYVAQPLGEWLNYDNFPMIGNLLYKSLWDIRITEFRLKKEFRRPRPHHLNRKIENSIDSPAFPWLSYKIFTFVSQLSNNSKLSANSSNFAFMFFGFT